MLQAQAAAWEPDYLAESRRRTALAQRMVNEPAFMQQMMWFYSTHPVEWIGDWCVTYDPRNLPPLLATMPFVLFDKQIEFIEFLYDCLKGQQCGLVEKCRDMGATWVCCAFSVWLWLFSPGSVGWGSRTEDLVDTLGDPDSIFEKIRMVIDNLPVWMLPAGFNPHNKMHSSYMKIINPERGSTITGEGGKNIGRGGRKTIYFKDESAHYEQPEKIEAALGENTRVQIDISSVQGTANPFYKRRKAGVLWTRTKAKNKEIPSGKTRIFIFDWRDHPHKTQEWYNEKRKKHKEEGILHVFAQEIERNYSAALDKIIIDPMWIEAAVDAHIALKFNSSGEKVAGQDVADEGKDKNAVSIRHGVIMQYCRAWAGDAGEAAEETIPLCVEYEVNELDYDSIGVGSGFKVGCNNLKKLGAVPKHLKIIPWNAAQKVLDPNKRIIPGDVKSMKNEDFYGNLKAQAWWSLRVRFKKTYEMRFKGKVYPVDELISLPAQLENLEDLKLELAQAVRKYDGKGRVIVDKKPDGSTSPNLADSCVICYYPLRRTSILDVL